MEFLKQLACIAFVAMSSAASAATIDIEVAEQGGDVVYSYAGAFDTTGLSITLAGSIDNFINPGLGLIGSRGSGPALNLSQTDVYSVSLISAYGPTNNLRRVGVSTGDAFVINQNVVVFAQGYLSGTAFSGTLTIENSTFLDLGITATGATSSTVGNNTVNISFSPAVTPVPLPAGFGLLFTALGGLTLVKRRRNRSMTA